MSSGSNRKPGDTLSFNPIRELLNPKFESYKLESTSELQSTSIYTLPSNGIKLRTLPDHSRLSYSEVQARVRHNHLSAGLNDEVLYIDGELKVIIVALDDLGVPTFHQLLQLPTHLSSSSKRLAEYPTAIPIELNTWALSDGCGRIYIVAVEVSTDQKWSGKIEACYEFEVSEGRGGGELSPFRLHHVDLLPSGQILALLSTSEKIAPTISNPLLGPGGLSTTARTKIPSTTVFDFVVVDLSIHNKMDDTMNNSPPTIKAESIWKLRCLDQPSYVAFDSTSLRYIISAPSGLFVPTDSSSLSSGDTPNFTRPISTTQDFIPAQNIPPSPSTLQMHRPPPFSWTQESSSLTIVFAVPSITPTSSIRVTFSRQFLTVHIGTPAAMLNPTTAASVHNYSLPHVSHKKLWDIINPHTSVWTFDREAEGRDSSFGLLSIHLEKGNVGTRWLEVFSISEEMEVIGGIREGNILEQDKELELEGIEETLDINQLANIAESMEKWTTDFIEVGDGGGGGGVGADNEGGIGMELPSSLMGEEIDVEVDGDSGRPIVITWIENILSITPKLIKPHHTIPYSILSIPLPLINSTSTTNSSSSIVIQHDVDGLLFNPPRLPSPSTYEWNHTSTFPALAFVLATKRDAYFVYHHSNQSVFAFDSPSNISTIGTSSTTNNKVSGAGNLFIYYNTEGIKDKFGKQAVIRIGGGNSGNLLGVVGKEIEGKMMLIALCEKELVVFRV